MKTTLAKLKAFLEDAHKNGTDCVTAEFYLTLAEETLRVTTSKEEKIEIKAIVEELNQIHNICFTQKQNEDDNECGII